MITVIVQHQVEDYDAWRPLFDGHGTVRREHECSSERVYRAVDDPNHIAVVMEYPTAEAAEGLLADPSLSEAMSRGGVIGAPTVTFGDEVAVPAP